MRRRILNLDNGKPFDLVFGDGSPEGVEGAYPGAEYIDQTSGRHWVKLAGAGTNIGWHQLAMSGITSFAVAADGSATVDAACVFTARGGRSAFKANGSVYGIGVSFDESDVERVHWGATASANPRHQFSDSPGNALMQLARQDDVADGQTAMLLLRNVGGTLTLQRVTLGVDDSGGAGFKVLRVPN